MNDNPDGVDYTEQEDRSKEICEYWDSGWCYHPVRNAAPTGCVGIANCDLERRYDA